ncbi:uncharacterized protein LOC133814635 [Humulus lupulus]|uniref:uncharacterized protein LOC133814635 n=1 Tax=Humulus lupulus TaxID=3486 RepID=UPI002B40524B|nr:uncharacterized protein LOC133814635 [Humulus lupulus]
MTWADFVQAFSKKYYSAVVLATRVDDFVTLVQRNLSATDYAQKFDKLVRFVPEIVPTEAMRVQKFIKRLKTMIARDVKMISVEVVSYTEVFDKAFDVEYLEDRRWKDSAARRDANRNKGFHEGNKRKAHGAGTNKCYKCDQTCHLKNDCPQWRTGAGQGSNSNLVPARVFSLTQKEASNSNTIVTSQLPISGMICRVLIDSGVTHSYVAMNVIDKLGFPCKLFEHSFSAMLPSGDIMSSTRWLQSFSIVVEGRECPADLIELDIPDYDSIFGMD